MLCDTLIEIRGAGRDPQMSECSFEHIDFVSSERPPLEMSSRCLGRWALECIVRVQEGDRGFEGIGI